MVSSKGLCRLGAEAGQEKASCITAMAPACRSSPGAAGLLSTLTEKGAEAAMLPECVRCNPVL